jgi:phosphonate C-P lyase system protein PhnG
MEYSRIMAEGSERAVQEMSELVAARLEVIVLRAPRPARVTPEHADDVQSAPSSLDGAYVTECEVEVDGRHGYGCCQGRREDRTLSAAIVDAVVGSGHPLAAELAPLLKAEEARIRERRRGEQVTGRTPSNERRVQYR